MRFGPETTGLDFSLPVTEVMLQDFIVLEDTLTVQEAIDQIRDRDVSYDIMYFYTVNAQKELCGVLNVKRLLISRGDVLIKTLVQPQVISLHEDMSILEASEMFLFHRYLSLPVINQKRQIQGIVNFNIFTHKSGQHLDNQLVQEIFQSIGLRIEELKNATVGRSFRLRFPWLLSTLLSGMACALLTGVFEVTLSKSIVLAFFLTLVLALGESVSMQSMTLALQRTAIQRRRGAYRKEILSGGLLGLACGLIVFVLSWLYRGEILTSTVIGLSILLSILSAATWGFLIPRLLHKLRLDPRIAAGPLTLALTDIGTIILYFSAAILIL